MCFCFCTWAVHGLVGSIPVQCNNFSLPDTLLNIQFHELVCIHPLMTKISHGCGWCFLPAIWAGEAALKFIVDIIIQYYLLYSD